LSELFFVKSGFLKNNNKFYAPEFISHIKNQERLGYIQSALYLELSSILEGPYKLLQYSRSLSRGNVGEQSNRLSQSVVMCDHSYPCHNIWMFINVMVLSSNQSNNQPSRTSGYIIFLTQWFEKSPQVPSVGNWEMMKYSAMLPST